MSAAPGLAVDQFASISSGAGTGLKPAWARKAAALPEFLEMYRVLQNLATEMESLTQALLTPHKTAGGKATGEPTLKSEISLSPDPQADPGGLPLSGDDAAAQKLPRAHPPAEKRCSGLALVRQPKPAATITGESRLVKESKRRVSSESDALRASLNETIATAAGQLLPVKPAAYATNAVPAPQVSGQSTTTEDRQASARATKAAPDSGLPRAVSQIRIAGEHYPAETNDVHLAPGPELKRADTLGHWTDLAPVNERVQRGANALTEASPESGGGALKLVPARTGDGPPLSVMADEPSQLRDPDALIAHRTQPGANRDEVTSVRPRQTASLVTAAPAAEKARGGLEAREGVEMRQIIPSHYVPPVAGALRPAEHASHEAMMASGSIRHDVIAALDRDGGNAPVHWIHATPQRAEAGFHDPSLGWVSVRAQADGGGVHASIVPNSSEAAQVLNSHLGALNSHLSETQANVRSVTMSPPERAWNSGGSGDSLSGQHQQQSERREPAQNSESKSPAGVLSAIASLSRKESLTISHSASSIRSASGRYHISVVA